MTEIQKLTAWFEAQEGTAERGENNVIYNTHYYGGPVMGASFPWCCAFIWDGFRECGLSRLFVGGEKTAYCPYVVNYARQHGQWVSAPYRAGDLLLYDWDGDGLADHIGFCVDASALTGTVTVIEGNADDRVMRLTRAAASVMGAYRPAYGGEEKDPSPAAQDDTGETAAREDIGRRTCTVRAGDSLWAIAARELGDGTRWDELRRLNGLPDTMIHPGDVLYLPGEDPSPAAQDDRDDAGETVALELRRDVCDRLIDSAAARGISVEELLEEVFK